MPSGVTPAGIRAGEPSALAGLVELRGNAVCAYTGAVAEPEAAREAAAEAMAGFRAHVVQAGDLRSLDPDAILLRAVRESSAARAPRPGASGARLRRLARRGESACELVPRLLAARANRELSHEDAVRLDRHLASCPGCRDLRERFRTAESLYAEAAGTSPSERDARALLAALAGAGPLAGEAPQSIAQTALALLYAETASPQGPPRAATEPSDAPVAEAAIADTPPAEEPPVADTPPSPADVSPVEARPPDPWPSDPSPAGASPVEPRPPDPWPSDPSPTGASPVEARPPDPWPSDPAVADARPAPTPALPEGPAALDDRDAPQPNGAEAPDAAAARHAAGFGTTSGRVSFARRTVIIRSGIERSGPAAPRPPAEPEPPAVEPEPPAVEPEPIAARVPEPPPEPDPHPASNGDPRIAAPETMPPPAAPTYPLARAAEGAPDSGALARVIPGLLIVMAIGIALVVAGILGVGRTPATSDDTQPPSLEEPVRDVDTTGTPPTPSAPGSEAAAATN